MVVILAALAYVAGSFPSGLVVGRAMSGRDVRRFGSGNVGAANVSRVAGLRAALLVLLLDMLKGLLPVLLAQQVGLVPGALAVVGGMAVLGHDYSLFLRFEGGKGVATTLGIMLALAPGATCIAGAAWLVVAGMTRYASAASLTALFVLPLALGLLGRPLAYVLLAGGLALLALVKHRTNVARLLAGTENPIGRTGRA